MARESTEDLFEAWLLGMGVSASLDGTRFFLEWGFLSISSVGSILGCTGGGGGGGGSACTMPSPLSSPPKLSRDSVGSKPSAMSSSASTGGGGGGGTARGGGGSDRRTSVREPLKGDITDVLFEPC